MLVAMYCLVLLGLLTRCAGINIGHIENAASFAENSSKVALSLHGRQLRGQHYLDARVPDLVATLDMRIVKADFYDKYTLSFWIANVVIYLSALLLAVLIWRFAWVWHLGEDKDFLVEKDFIKQDKEHSDSESEVEDAEASRSHLFSSNLSPLNQRRKAKRLNLRAKFQAKWLKETSNSRIRAGAQTLLFMGCTVAFYRIVRISHRPACAHMHWSSLFFESMVLFAVMLLTVYCIQRPTKYVYWPALIFYLFYIPAVNLPPFQWSCRALKRTCYKESNWFVTDAVYHADCGLQGQTAQQMLMTLILLMPWLLPQYRMMYLMWIWIVAVYLGWTITYEEYIDEKFFTGLDVAMRAGLLASTLVIACFKKHALEKSQQNMFVDEFRAKAATKKLYDIMEYMLPEHVIVTMLKEPGHAIAESIDCASIMFILIDGFEHFSQTRKPEELLDFLNSIFTKFDTICTTHGVTKIETVGEEYVCCVGVLPAEKAQSEKEGHTTILEPLFLVAQAILQLQIDSDEGDVKFKMGMHTGPVVAGVIGEKLPRYRLFGDTINTAARMMQRGITGELQFGKETYAHLPPSVQADSRGLIVMKGKGEIQTYLMVRPHQESTPPTELRDSNTTPTALPRRVQIDPFTEMARQTLFTINGGLVDALLQTKRKAASAADAMRSSSTLFSDAASTSQLISRSSKSVADMQRVVGQINVSKQFGFTGDMEQKWYAHYHLTKFSTKFVVRLDHTILAVLALSVVEAFYIIHGEVNSKPHALLPAGFRLPVFVTCRIGVMILIGALRLISVSSILRKYSQEDDLVEFGELSTNKSTWVLDSPRQVQRCALGVMCLSLVLIMLSYGCLTIHLDTARADRPDHIFALMFMLLFFLAMRSHPFLFQEACAFIPLAILFMFGIPALTGDDGLHYSVFARILFIIVAASNAYLAYTEEQGHRAHFEAANAQRITKERASHILKTLLPPGVLEQITTGVVPVHKYEKATVVQSDLCGFTKLASTLTPTEVVQLISELFGRFDSLTDKYGVYKVETIGDAYIAGQAEYPLTESQSPIAVIQFGCDMVLEVVAWSRSKGTAVCCRVGVHHGVCIGGVVGMDMQRYHLFGALLHELDHLESTAPEGGVQVSTACKDAVARELETLNCPPFELKKRELPFLQTSKGEQHQYSEVGGQTFLVQGPTLLRTDSQ